MNQTLGPRWFDTGEDFWQHEETGRVVDGDDMGPFVPIDEPDEPMFRLIPEQTYQAMLTNIDYRTKFEHLGQVGDVYMKELRAQLVIARACLEATAEFSLDPTSRRNAADALRQMGEWTHEPLDWAGETAVERAERERRLHVQVSRGESPPAISK